MAVNGKSGSRPASGDGRLRSWKEIASYFGADERTVKRWEVTRGLPVHRVPGEARAPVYAYEAELAAWLHPQPGTAPAAGMRASESTPQLFQSVRRRVLWRWFSLVIVVVLVILTIVAAQGWRRAAIERQTANDRVADVRQLARSQVAALSDRLEKQPGTVRLRAALAQEAAAMLGRVAAHPDATPALRHDAAEAYRRLATVQNSTERPSLRDRPAARAALEKALTLVANDKSNVGRQLRARILIDAARQAAADGALAKAPAMLDAAAANAIGAPPALRDELLLGQAEVADWQGEYAVAIALADRVSANVPADAEAALRQLRAFDLAAEGHYYAGDKAAALTGYRAAASAAAAGAARWPDEPRFRWALQRQQWNLGTTLIDFDRASEALPMLRESRDGWMTMAKADPEDGAVASWVRTSRLAYGQALAGAGHVDTAVAELAASLGDRREWLAERPEDTERRRSLVVGLNELAQVLVAAGRRSEACALSVEASAMTRRMASRDSLTKLDRDSLLPLTQAGLARNCLPGSPL